MIFDWAQKQGASVELAELLEELAAACARISSSIVTTHTGQAGSQNASGEEQAAMDLVADRILTKTLESCPFVAAYGSEELDDLVAAQEDGCFTVLHDPLDGSSLLDVNFSVGTIIGIYEGQNPIGQTARDQVAAVVAVYGPRTTLLVTVGTGTFEFLWQEEVWQGPVQLKLEGDKKYFAPGNLRATLDDPKYLKLLQYYMTEQYTLRYSGGMVPDVNHILKKGAGVFVYPGGKQYPQGKLRLLFECGPMAFLMEQAGGAASSGIGPILDLKIEALHQRTPIILGSKKEVERAVSALF